jgi:hypothetical protein
VALENNRRKSAQSDEIKKTRTPKIHVEQRDGNNVQEQTTQSPQQSQTEAPQFQSHQPPPEAPQKVGGGIQHLTRSGSEQILDAGERVFLDVATEDVGVQTIKRQERIARGTLETVQQLSATEDAGLRRGVFAAPSVAARMAQEAMPDKDSREDSGIQATRTATNEIAATTMILATASPPVKFRLRRQYAEKEAKAAAEKANDIAAQAKQQVEKIEGLAKNAHENLMCERGVEPPLSFNSELGNGTGVPGGLATRGGQKILEAAHSRISEIEDDIGNSGVKLTHGIEQRAENATRSNFRRLRRIGHKLKQRTEKEAVKKLKHGKTVKTSATVKASAIKTNATVQTAAAKKKAVAAARKAARRKAMLTKLKVAKAKLLAGKSAFLVGKSAFLAGKTAVSVKAGVATGGISLAVQAAIYAAIIIAIIYLIIIIIFIVMIIGLIGMLGGGMSAAIDIASYAADPHKITAASVHMTELQADFVENIHAAMQEGDEVVLVINGEAFTFPVSIFGGHGGVFLNGSILTPPTAPDVIPPDVPEIPSLISLLPEISHCPWEVMAYLTILYRDFNDVDIFEILAELFGEVFKFSYTTHIETRTHTVPVEHYVTTVDGWIVQVSPATMQISVAIEVRTVNVVTNGTISDAIQTRLGDWTETILAENENFEPLPHDHFKLLMATGGLRQIVFSPFAEDWRGSVSSIFGYRFHPIYGHRHFHPGIDIAMPEGTPILSGFRGEFTIVETGDMGGYGYTVIIEANCPDSGATVRLLYAHMETILVDVGEIVSDGQIILGTVGQTGTATGPHLHLEISVRAEGETEFAYLNPAFFVLPEII